MAAPGDKMRIIYYIRGGLQGAKEIKDESNLFRSNIGPRKMLVQGGQVRDRCADLF